MKRITILSLMILLYSTIAFGGWLGGPDNYDDCMVKKMKGQNFRDYRTREHAKRACEREFEVKIVEIDDIVDIDIDWVDTTEEGVVIKMSKNNSDFRITKAILLFSKKSCKESKDTDFIVLGTADFDSILNKFNDDKQTTVKIDQAYNIKCFRTMEVHGKRIK